MDDPDLALALQLQEQFDQDIARNYLSPSSPAKTFSSSKSPISIVDESWELTDPHPDIRALFLQYNDTFFWGKLAGIEVRWSPRMTLCAGLCVYEGRGGLCSVRLSLPLLKLRPRKDLVETLLHEMIHAYLFVTQNNKDHDGHGPEFQKHMNRINNETGTKISIYHNFHDEVDVYRQHWWRCDGPCRSRKPYFGFVKRAMNRAPSARDPWWGDHQRTCGGTYTKVKEPDGYGQKKGKKEKNKEESNSGKPKVKSPDIRSFWGQGTKVTTGKIPPTSTATSSSSIDLSDEDSRGGDDSNINNVIKHKNETSSSGSNVSTIYGSLTGSNSGASNARKTHLPGKISVKTIWDETSGEETGNASKSFQDPQDSRNTFSGQGRVLGQGQAHGTSFLAQLRREMKTAAKVNSYASQTSASQRNNDSDGKTSVKSMEKSEASTNQNGAIMEDDSVSFLFSSQPSSEKSLSTKDSSEESTFDSKLKSDSENVIDDADDWTSPRKPLFKKVNPSPNFTSPPFKRISLFDDSAECSPGIAPASSDVIKPTLKRKHSGSGDVAQKKSDTKFKSWTRKPQYSSSDSDVEEIVPNVKRPRTDGKEDLNSFKSIKSDNVFKKVKNRDKNIVDGKGKHVSKRPAKGSTCERPVISGIEVGSGPAREGNSSTSDPLQDCPACHIKVCASQMNSHLDQCLSFD